MNREDLNRLAELKVRAQQLAAQRLEVRYYHHEIDSLPKIDRELCKDPREAYVLQREGTGSAFESAPVVGLLSDDLATLDLMTFACRSGKEILWLVELVRLFDHECRRLQSGNFHLRDALREKTDECRRLRSGVLGDRQVDQSRVGVDL